MVSWKPDPRRAGPLYGKDPWPLRFYSHSFDGLCYNTLACSLIYNGHQFGTQTRGYLNEIYDKPSGPPPSPQWHEEWYGYHGISPFDQGGRTFAAPVEIKWTALDGSRHEAAIDLDHIFKDRLILHNVPREEVTEGWLASCSVQPVTPEILVAVNDRTVSVYMRATVATKAEQIPGNPNSHTRRDVILAWSHTY